MPTSQPASVFADPPVYAAGRSARTYDIPGAATRGDTQVRGSGMWLPALYFFGGLAAGALMAVTIARAVLK